VSNYLEISRLNRQSIINKIENNQLTMSDELDILHRLWGRFNFFTISESAKIHGKTYNGMRKRIDSGQELCETFSGVKFVSVDAGNN
jgi:hypothetical protein